MPHTTEPHTPNPRKPTELSHTQRKAMAQALREHAQYTVYVMAYHKSDHAQMASELNLMAHNLNTIANDLDP